MLTDLIYYDLKAAALIGVFYLFYMLLLARETTHTLNRLVLLMGIVLSLVLPLCIITVHQKSLTPLPLSDWGGEPIVLPLKDEIANVTTPLSSQSGSGSEAAWLRLFAAILLSGSLLRLLYLAQGYRKLRTMICGGESHTLPSGTHVCLVDAPVAPFSWCRTVVMSRADWQSQPAAILAHEEAHVRHRHSYDVVVVELLTALQWFNPVVWFMRQELRIVHEYEADASVLSRGFDESQYIHLLMQKATGIQACVLANGIHTPKTKKRIIMMLKPKSSRTAWLKALYVVPITLVSLAMTAQTVVDYETTQEDNNPSKAQSVFIVNGQVMSVDSVQNIQKQDIDNVSVVGNRERISKVFNVEADSAVIIETKQAVDSRIFDICEQMPQFPGGGEKLMGFIAHNTKYPKEATEWGVMGRVVVKFVVEKDGRITSPTVVLTKGLDEPSDTAVAVTVNGYLKEMTEEQRREAEAQDAGLKAGMKALEAEAVRVVNAMPKWEPGRQNGQTVRCYYALPVTFRLY